MSKPNWNDKNVLYWNKISEEYRNLYDDPWSLFEDIQLKRILLESIKKNHVVLDLGCGLGLGYNLICERDIKYYGVDISEYMLDRAKQANPNIQCYHSSMDSLSFLRDQSVDIVISINTSFSFCEQQIQALMEIRRVLKKGGIAIISVLNKWSLRRLIQFKFSKTELYRTRNTKSKSRTPANTYTLTEFANILRNNGYEVDNVHRYGVLSGVAQKKIFWQLNIFLSKIIPCLSHDILFKTISK